MTIRETVIGATRVLADAGCETPRLDAEILLAEALAVGRAQLVIDADSQVEPRAAARFAAFIARRAEREPVAYIVGRKAFRHITLRVDPRVLIPRPETELLVEPGLTLPWGARALDVGTGSGAVALALKHERPDLEVWGSDLSAEALAVARANGERLGLDIHWVQADLLEGIPRRFDAILANPPYVASGAVLPPEIEHYEPEGALFAGPDGLEVIRRLVAEARHAPLLALEVGYDQAAAVSALMRDAGFASVEALRDLAGRERVVVGRR